MPEIVITEFMDRDAVDTLARDFSLRYDPELATSPVVLKEAAGAARALIVRNRTQVDAALLSAAPRLEAVGRLGVGLDNIDVAACAARGIAVCPATGANAAAVAEYVIAAALLLLRGAFGATPRVVAGGWPREASVGREAAGKTLGLVGFGAIGQEVAQRARALGMTVLACDPQLAPGDPAWSLAEPAPLEALLAGSDAVSLHVPLTAATRGLIGAAQIEWMKPSAVLINTARGGIVDEAALVSALRGGRLAGAALDVFEAEPLDAETGGRFAAVPNLLLTPHIAGLTEESNARVASLVADKVRAVLEPKP